MKVCIATNKTVYKGMDRDITSDDILSPEITGKRVATVQALDEYFAYVADSSLSLLCAETFERICSYYLALKSRGVMCEMIAYDTHPLSEAFGHSLQFLGLDIVHELCESLLESDWEQIPEGFLNENCLCKAEEDIPDLIKLCRHGGLPWRACWVYRVQMRAPSKR